MASSMKDRFPFGLPLSQDVRALPKRLLRGLPAIVLGVLLNSLDAASTGLLVFPSGQQGVQFAHLQSEAMAIYIMSTIMSQLSLTLGGSLFSGSLGSMLIEVLPFLRGMATDIQDSLGEDSPKLLPTVMVAYALTSFLIGLCFILLGMLRLGWVVEYFPRTVLTGTIGAIGLSLFLLSLQLTLPVSAPELTLSSAHHVLFNSHHGPLLAASLLPTIFLCVSLRVSWFAKVTRGFTDHAMYVPIYVLTIAALFWIIAAAVGKANASGMDHLASQGWLFTVDLSGKPMHGLGTGWNYWALFDFNLVEWSAMSNASQNIVLTVIIGVLNLPIYIPAMAIMLDQPKFSMNWELFGHGISNILSGSVGSLPNLVVLSNTRLFTFANGGRPEALIVTGFTVVLFFVSARLLPYVPTILASILVFFLGIELMTDAVWSSTKELLLIEWLVVVGTMAACTFVGFLPGFGVGMALAILSHAMLSVTDTKARLSSITQSYSKVQSNLGFDSSASSKMSCLHNTEQHLDLKHIESKLNVHVVEAENSTAYFDDNSLSFPDANQKELVHIVATHGNLFFGSIPALEKQIDNAVAMSPSKPVILDFSGTNRIETCIGSMISRKIAEYASTGAHKPFIFAEFNPHSGLEHDLSRAGVHCRWPQFTDTTAVDGVVECYKDIASALAACKQRDSSHDSYTAVEQILHNTFLHFDRRLSAKLVRDLIASDTKLYHLDAGSSLSLQNIGLLLIVRGAATILPSEPLHFAVNEDHTIPAHRLPLFDTCKALLERTVCINLRSCVSRFNASSGRRKDTPALQLFDGTDESLHCEPGDLYTPSSARRQFWKSNAETNDEEKLLTPEYVAPAQGVESCTIVCIPTTAGDAINDILSALQRRRLQENMINALVHRSR